LLLDERRTRLLLRVPRLRLCLQILLPELVLLALICVVRAPDEVAGGDDVAMNEELDGEEYMGVVLGVVVANGIDELGAAEVIGSFISGVTVEVAATSDKSDDVGKGCCSEYEVLHEVLGATVDASRTLSITGILANKSVWAPSINPYSPL
jgi:hypothetical protein